MKVFYSAKNYSGQTRGGELEVKNERDLAAQLRSEGFILTSFKELKEDSKTEIEIKFLDKFFGISIKEKLMFARNISVMISSGLPLSRAINNLSVQTKNKRFSKILGNIFTDLQSGLTFADSLSKYPAVFDELFVNMINVGEASGNLEEVLEILALQLEKEHSLKSKIKGAMTYPAVIVVVMVVIGIIMLTYILPKMLSVFDNMQVTLPASTRFMILISDTLKNHNILVAMTLIAAGLFLKIFLMTSAGKKTVGFLAIHVPVISSIVIKMNCARFSRIHSSLLRSGVSVIEALRIISNTLTNHYYKNAISESIEQVKKGVNLSDILKKYPSIFPILLIQMLEVGEETGKTEAVLMKLAEFYEAEVDQFSKNMSSIIEPVLMVMIGSAVGFFAVSMLQPMYSIMDSIK